MTTNKQQLTDNNQSEYARERAAADKVTTNNPSSLTSNTDQPGKRFSAGQPPSGVHTPQNATTGCTTLLPDTGDMATELPQKQQSVDEIEQLWLAAHPRPESGPVFDPVAMGGQNAPLHQSDMTIFPNCPQRMEKDPPATSPDVHIKDFNTPQERVVPTTLPDYQGPYVHIVHDQGWDGGQVSFKDDNGDFSPGTWHFLTDDPQVCELSVPDWRHLRAELARANCERDTYKQQLDTWTDRFVEETERLKKDHAVELKHYDAVLADARNSNYETECANLVSENKSLKAELLATTAQKQQLTAEKLRLLTNIDGDNQRIRELREANLTLVNKRLAATNENARISRENHNLRKALKESTEAMTAGIAKLKEMHDAAERIKEILK